MYKKLLHQACYQCRKTFNIPKFVLHYSTYNAFQTFRDATTNKPYSKWDVVRYKKKKEQFPKTKLTKEEIKEAEKELTDEKLMSELIPFKDPRKMEALKKGQIRLPIEKDLVVEMDREKEEIYGIYPKDDPHWEKLKAELMGPLVETMEERMHDLLNEETNVDLFFEQYPKDIQHYNWLLRAQAAQNKMELAIETLNRMEQDGILPNSQSYCTVISACAVRRDPLSAAKYLKEMTEKGMKPPLAAYGALVNALIRAYQIDEAFDIVEAMHAHDIETDQVIHATLLHGCIKQGDLTRAWSHYERMQLEFGIKPDEVTYSIMINACAEGGQTERAFKLLNEMEIAYMIPTEVTYNTLIKACCSRKDTLHKVPEVFEKMEAAGYKPNITTFNLLIYWAGKSGYIQKVPKMLDEMKKLKVKPDQYTYNIFFHALGSCQQKHFKKQNEHIEIALALYDQMKTELVPITSYTLNGVLGVLSKALRCNRALEFFRNEFKSVGMKPDRWSYTLMINMYSKVRKFDKALQLLEEMKQNQLKPTYDAYKNLSFCYCSAGYSQKALETLKIMFEEEGYMLNPPDIIKFKSILAGSRVNRIKVLQEEKDAKIDVDEYLNSIY